MPAIYYLLVIYCFLTNFPKIWWLKTKNIISPIFCGSWIWKQLTLVYLLKGHSCDQSHLGPVIWDSSGPVYGYASTLPWTAETHTGGRYFWLKFLHTVRTQTKWWCAASQRWGRKGSDTFKVLLQEKWDPGVILRTGWGWARALIAQSNFNHLVLWAGPREYG